MKGLPEAFFSQFWEVALALPHEGQRTRVLGALGWAIVLDLIMAQMCKTGDADFALHILKAADPPMLQSSSAQFYPIVHEVLRLLAQRERRDTLPDLALLAPVVYLLGGEEAITEMFEATLEIGSWWP